MLAERKNIETKVFYTWSQTEKEEKYDPGFGANIQWNIPLLDGYEYAFIKNVSPVPGSHHFKGIENPTLIEEVEKWEPSAVLIYGWSFKSHLKALRYFKGRIPVFFRGDSTLLDPMSFLKKIARTILLRHIYKYIDIALYAGNANKLYFKAAGVKETQLVFMPHAIDNQRFSFETGSPIRKMGGITSFLFAGKLEPKKQPLELAAAFIQLNEANTELIIAGSGELKEQLSELCRGWTNIKLIGFVNQQEMPGLYANADVFVLPSRGPGETWGLAINEAMAAGKVIICTDVCGAASDLVMEGRNGYVINAKDNNGIYNALKRCVDKRAYLKGMGKESLEIIQQYSFMEDCKAVESLFRNANLAPIVN